MKTTISLVITSLLFGFVTGCGGAKATGPELAGKPVVRAGLQIRHANVYVDDQEKALRFYTDVLGFVKKDDVSNGPYRWLTVTAAQDPAGVELQLALDDNPAAKTYQEALFQQGQPAAMFYTDDVQADYERLQARGVEFTMPPTDVTMSKIATLKDTCGNFIQLTQLMR
jgi:predicted enzyme related to lactoylglutathione lyase